MPVGALKRQRIEARVRPDDKVFIEEAARYLGMSVTDFVTSSAREHAEQVIARRDLIVLSRRDQVAFISALMNPPAPNEALKAAVTAYNSSVER
jgi:uncharacterized protein (DUF1778 family)